MSFAKNLSAAMSAQMISQSELALAINKCKSSVSQYLSGRSVPRQDVQQAIAKALDCTVEWLNTEDEVEVDLCLKHKKISVAECAHMLGKSEQFIRVALQNGTAPFGFAAKTKNRYSYHISPKKLSEYIGKELN